MVGTSPLVIETLVNGADTLGGRLVDKNLSTIYLASGPMTGRTIDKDATITITISRSGLIREVKNSTAGCVTPDRYFFHGLGTCSSGCADFYFQFWKYAYWLT